MKNNDKIYDELVRAITDTYRDIETELIYEIVEKLIKLEGLTETEFIEAVRDFKFIDDKIIKIVEKITGEPLNSIYKGIDVVGETSLDTDVFKKAYEMGVIYVDPDDIRYDEVLKSYRETMLHDMRYIEKQSKIGMYRNVSNILHKASLSVELGVYSPNESLAKAVQELSRKGITSNTYMRNGKEVHENIEGVVRRTIRTSFTNVMADMNRKLGEELGTEHWYMSQHMGARAKGVGYHNHAQWQGKVYETEELTTICGLGEDTGYLGYNCRHLARPHIKGISVIPPENLDMQELERVYELEQRQRRYERDIRITKREIESLKLMDFEEANNLRSQLNVKLKKQQKKLREYIKLNDDVLKRDYSRESIYTKQ